MPLNGNGRRKFKLLERNLQMKEFFKGFIIDFILDLAFCFGAGSLIAYSGILNGMDWFQIICLIFGARFILYYWYNEKEK